MSKYYRKVMCSDEMPKEHKVYSTNKGDMLFVAKDKMFGKRLYGGIIVSYPEWWLEEIELPSEEDIVKIAKEFEIYGTECSWWMFGFRKAIELIKGGTK